MQPAVVQDAKELKESVGAGHGAFWAAGPKKSSATDKNLSVSISDAGGDGKTGPGAAPPVGFALFPGLGRI